MSRQTATAAALLFALSCAPTIVEPIPRSNACSDVVLRELVPEKARFSPGEIVQLFVDVSAADDVACSIDLRFAVYDVEDLVHEQTIRVAVPAGGMERFPVEWDAPDTDFHGYMATLSVPGGTQPTLSTGVDVSSVATRFPRYGYISEFPPEQTREESAELVRTLAEEFHLNMFQLYDWFWRHEDLIPNDPATATWVDLFGRLNARATVQNLVDVIHDENALAMAYVTLYAAREGYEQLSGVSPAWGLYETPFAGQQVSLAFGGERALYLFDPSNTAWRLRMASEYADAVRAFNFDGVHIDQFGPRPTLFRADGSPVELNETFAPFLEFVDATLTEAVPGRQLCVFNLVEGRVDGYGVEAVARSTACDILYSEIWFTTNTYEDLLAYIQQLRDIGGNRAVVLALYAQYGEDVGVILQAEEAARLEGVAVNTDHAGFTGGGFIDQFGEIGDSITWDFTLSEQATITFVVRYANATGERATRTVLLDGEPIGKVTLRPLGSWDDWAFDAWVQQPRVPVGAHQVTLVYAEDDTGAANIDRLTLGEFDEDSVRLQNAAIFAAGATPIQIGDDVQSLAHEYFPNRSKSLGPSLQRALRSQYSFLTAHETLLVGPDVTNIEERLQRVEAVSPGHRLITDSADGIWTVLRRTPAGEAIHLVNLVGVDNGLWRDAAPTPIPQTDVVLRYRVEDASAVRAVLWATPDEGTGVFQPLELRAGDGFIEFTVPRLAYWDVVLVRF